MTRGTLMLAAGAALAPLPAAARADATGCRAELQQLAQTHRLSLSPPPASGARASPDTAAEAPATTESRGLAGAPDSLGSSGGTLPPATGTPSSEQQRHGGAPAQPLGAADRVKIEGLLSQGQTAASQGKGDECLEALRQARSLLEKSRP